MILTIFVSSMLNVFTIISTETSVRSFLHHLHHWVVLATVARNHLSSWHQRHCSLWWLTCWPKQDHVNNLDLELSVRIALQQIFFFLYKKTLRLPLLKQYCLHLTINKCNWSLPSFDLWSVFCPLSKSHLFAKKFDIEYTVFDILLGTI